MELTEFFKSLPEVSYRNKYELASHYFNLDYKLLTGKDAYLSDLPISLKQFIIESEEVVVLPNRFKGEIVGFLLRSVYSKGFRYYSESKIPYGAGVNNKPYNLPWVVVESCLDSDFLRRFYPYIISSLGASVSSGLREFIFNTSPYSIIALDNDDSGNNEYSRLYSRYRKKVVKLEPPLGNKDFGDTLENLVKKDFCQFELECSLIEHSIRNLVGEIC